MVFAAMAWGGARLLAQNAQSAGTTYGTSTVNATANGNGNAPTNSTSSGALSAGTTGSTTSSPSSTSAVGLTTSSAQLVLNPSSLQNPYYGSVTMGTVSPETLHLTLDDAIQRGIQANLAITQARIQQQESDAQRLESLNSLLPDVKAEASTAAHQFNLATFGFSPSLISQFAPLFPGLNIANFKTI